MKTVLQNHVPHNTGWSAEMDLLVALSACPDLAVGGKPVDVMVYQE
ncbi:MAG TPA: hypothetical protein VEB61_01045 [Candidatus Binatia bacterium]|nr:hypothetical protein [Candidatus Binatia bacterium]